MTVSTRPGSHAVVAGGSMAGLLAACVLADHYDRVTLLERDRLPDAAEPRKGTPQARHIHVLLAAGRRVIEGLLPGFTADLFAAGAIDVDTLADIEWISPAGPGVRFASDLRMLGASRPLIEWGVRRRVLAHPKIHARTEVDVEALRVADGRVVGVEIEDRSGSSRTTEAIDADLVVDATGRASKAPRWLEAAGYPVPRETVINGFLGYATRTVRAPANWAGEWKGFYLQTAPPRCRRGGLIAPIEGGRYMVGLIGGGKDYPPTDEAEYVAFARSLPDPRLAAFLEASEPLTPIVGTKTSENRIRHYEELPRRPAGLLVTGDAVCAFNPVYGQGMSTAALGADALDRCLRAGRTNLEGRFQKELARSNARPWLMATGEDYRYAEAEGPKPGWTTRLAHGYLDRVIALATKDRGVRRKFMEVLHLIRSPNCLFTPDLLVRAALTWA